MVPRYFHFHCSRLDQQLCNTADIVWEHALPCNRSCGSPSHPGHGYCPLFLVQGETAESGRARSPQALALSLQSLVTTGS